MATTSQAVDRSPGSGTPWVSRVCIWFALLVVLTVPWRDAVSVFGGSFTFGLLIGGGFRRVWVGKLLITSEMR